MPNRNLRSSRSPLPMGETMEQITLLEWCVSTHPSGLQDVAMLELEDEEVEKA